MNLEDVEKLENLARLKLTSEQKESFLHEIDPILNFVQQVKEASAGAENASETKPISRNIWREDGNPHQSGIFTETLLNSAPSRHGNYIKVKKIL